jgi:ribosomal protein S18 acetylase RimI-like enzyme
MSTTISDHWQARAPQDNDFARWRELFQAYADFYQTPQPEPAAELVWSWIRDPQHEVNCLLAEDQHGHLAGLAHYRAFARPLAAGAGGYLEDLFVDPAHRGTGVVDALLGELRGLARDKGWSIVRWITAQDNYRAQAKYDQYATPTTWITYDMNPTPAADAESELP